MTTPPRIYLGRQRLSEAIGAAGLVAAFALAGVVTVPAYNQWSDHPFTGWFETLVAVLLAWVAGEALLKETEIQDHDHVRVVRVNLGRVAR